MTLKSSEKNIRFYLLGLPVVTLLVLVILAYWNYLTDIKLHTKDTKTIIERILELEKEYLEDQLEVLRSQESFYEKISQGVDGRWIKNNISLPLEKALGRTSLAIYEGGKQFRTLYASHEFFGRSFSTPPSIILNSLLDLYDSLKQGQSVTKILAVPQGAYLISLGSILGGSPEKKPYLLIAKKLDGVYLQTLSKKYGIPQLYFKDAVRANETGPEILIKNGSTPVGVLYWKSDNSLLGILLMYGVLYLVFLVGFLGFYVVVSRLFYDLVNKVKGTGTELEATLESLKKAEQDMLATKKSKIHLLSMMSHEIKTPMNGLIGMVGLLKETPLDVTQLSYINTMESSAESLMKLVDNILEFSKLENDEVSLVFGEVDLRQLVSEIHSLMMPVSIQKRISFDLFFDENVPLTVRTDAVRLRQIILHLVSNALKFTKVGSVKINVVSTDLIQNRVEIGFQIIDTGIGIPESIKASLFKDFLCVGTSIPQVEMQGAGLGLAIVKNLIHLLQGKIGLESKLGQGSVFWVQIEMEAVKRYKKSDKATHSSPEVPITSFSRASKKSKVLVVSSQDKGLVQNLLEKGGHFVSKMTLNQAREALKENKNYDAVIVSLATKEDLKENVAQEISKVVFWENQKPFPLIGVIDNLNLLQEVEEEDLEFFDNVIYPPLTTNKLNQVFG